MKSFKLKRPTRVSRFLIPHSSSLITHHSSLIIPHSSFLTHHSSLLIPHSSLITHHSSLITLILLLTLASCGPSRYIPEGGHLLHRTEQTVVMADSSDVTPEVKDALKKAQNYYLQRPNSKVFGIQALPVGMWIYCVASPTDSTFWGRYWRNLGQAPVIYEEGKAQRTAQQLQRLLETKGCFNSTVTFDTTDISDQKISIGYRIRATHRYIIDDITYHCGNLAIMRLLENWQAESPLQAGNPYDQDKLAAERTRLVNNLREEGYYQASLENISFVVDTTYHNRRLSIDVYVNGDNLQIYHINNIYIYPNSTAGLRSGESQYDTLIYNYSGVRQAFDYQFIYDKPMTIHPLTISRSMMLFPGMTYRPRYINSTYNSLLNLRNFKYINVEFSESPFSTDSLPLVDAHVRLINTTQQKLSLSLEITNASSFSASDTNDNFFTNGNFGLETSLEYQHKNLFGGAELLKVKGTLLLELPKLIFSSSSSGNGFYDNVSAFETGLDISLDMPEFLMPFSSLVSWQRTRPHTLITLGGSYQYRYWFERIVANTSFGYAWTQRIGTGLNSMTAQHQLTPIDLTFVRILGLDGDFIARIINQSDLLRLAYQYSDHFIMAARYDFSYSNQQFGIRKNFSTYRFSVESACNLLSLLSNLFDGNVDSNGVRQFFDVPFSQYVRFSGEYTRYFYHGKKNTFVAHCLLGIGLPYSNSTEMPYEKSFFGGGPTTMRAWPLRRLGPGGFDASTVSGFERVGDLQLVVNLEERFPLAGIFEGALFADIGNIWVVNPTTLYPDGEFRWDRFYKEIAVGLGLGLRVNVSVATLRLDFAIPLYDPGFSESLRWRPHHWAFNQIVTNFGINYPF